MFRGCIEKEVKMQEMCSTVQKKDSENSFFWDVCLHNVLLFRGHLQIKSMKMLMLLKTVLVE